MKIKDLPLGTRFRLKEGDGKTLWVLLDMYGNGLIAEWVGLHGLRAASGYPIQSLCSIVDETDGPTKEYVVIVNEEDN